MKESFLQNCWKYKIIPINNLTTTLGKKVIVHNVGTHNLNEGPDFLNAKIEIDGKIWFGSVEIHLKNSDWKNHKHHLNKNYDTVILHLVYKMDVSENFNNIPTIELEPFIPKEIINQSENWTNFEKGFIPCENQLLHVGESFKILFLESLYFKKLEEKNKLIEKELQENLFHWEAVFFKNIAYSLGLKINATAFYNLANSLPFILIEKASKNKWDLEALLMGQAGFLNQESEEEYVVSLKNTFEYYKHKYQLSPLNKEQFKFFRLRPVSFPTIKIAQLSAIYKSKENVFSELIKLNSLKDFYDFLENISLPNYWDNHYVLNKKSNVTNKKSISKATIDLIIINTIIPFKFSYQKLMGEEQSDDLLAILNEIKPEDNTIIKNFKAFKVVPKDAIQSQALLYLKKNYCDQKKCLTCSFGLEILKKTLN